MSVVVIGLNHRTMPLDLFERLTVEAERLPKILGELDGRPDLSEVVVLSTCNRTEVYAVAERFHGAYREIRSTLAEQSQLVPEDIIDHLYVHYDREAIRHLFTVAAGLDSAVPGEAEVLRQVRDAWGAASDLGHSGPTLNLLFRHAVKAGKRARTETGIARGTASVSHAAVAMAGEHLGSLEGRRVLVLGAGEMGEGMITALSAAGVTDVAVANRTRDRAVEVAERTGGRPVRLAELADHLAEVDLVLTSTGARAMMLEHADLEPLGERRAGRPLLVVDIAVPRDVDPAVGDLEGVSLLDMGDLRRFAQAGLSERRREFDQVEAIVAEEVDHFVEASSARAAAPLVGALHRRAEELRQSELARHRGRLADLDDREWAAVEAMTRGILAKVLHEPSVKLKDLAGTPKGDRLAEALRHLYDLDE